MKTIMQSTAALVGLAFVAACGGDSPEHPSASLPPVAVTVAPLAVDRNAEIHSARVVADREIDISTRMAGMLIEIAALGSRVEAGDVLARIDAADVEAAVARAEAQAELATRTLDRIRNLHEAGAASTQELDQAVAAQRAAETGVDEARAQLAYTTLTAPVPGIVTGRIQDEGDLASPGMPVLRLASTGRLLRAELPESLADGIAVGTPVTVVETGEQVEVLRVSPVLDARTRRFTVELGAPAGMRPGRVVDLAFDGVDATAAPRVPADAVVRRGQLTGVFTVDADTLRLRWVRLGREEAGAFELLSGPLGLSTVVVGGVDDLHDGAPVSAVTERAPASGDER